MMKLFALTLLAISLTSCGLSNSESLRLPSAINFQNHAPATTSDNPLESDIPSAAREITQEPVSNRDPKAELEIKNQSGDGTYLMIDELEFSLNRVWLVIQSQTGEVYFSGLIEFGAKWASIKLAKPLNSGSYSASLHIDNGDEVFDLKVDKIIHGHENQLAQHSFEYSRTQ